MAAIPWRATALSRLAELTRTVGVHEAKTHLSRLLEQVAAGEEVEITNRGEHRLLVSQAVAEGAVLLTADRRLTAYGDAVRLVG